MVIKNKNINLENFVPHVYERTIALQAEGHTLGHPVDKLWEEFCQDIIMTSS